MEPMSRRTAVQSLLTLTGGAIVSSSIPQPVQAAKREPTWEKSIDKGLKWVARTQSQLGHWTAANYPTAMTALAGMALVCSGSTATQGPYAKNIRRAVDYLMTKVRVNGLIGDPMADHQYTYGHGFSMLFLSQVLGEEEDED